MVDKIIGIVLAALLPTLTLLIHHNVITSVDATDLSAIIFAGVTGWHGRSIVLNKKDQKLKGNEDANGTGTG